MYQGKQQQKPRVDLFVEESMSAQKIEKKMTKLRWKSSLLTFLSLFVQLLTSFTVLTAIYWVHTMDVRVQAIQCAK